MASKRSLSKAEVDGWKDWRYFRISVRKKSALKSGEHPLENGFSALTSFVTERSMNSSEGRVAFLAFWVTTGINEGCRMAHH